MKSIREKIKIFYCRFKFMCQNLTVHGPSYLFRSDVHFVYRFIYFVIYIQVWIAAVASIYKYISTYQEDTIRFTTRTDYLDWNTTFPSITVCEIANADKIETEIEKLLYNSSNKDKILSIAKDIAFFAGECPNCVTLSNIPISNLEFVNISLNLRSECKDLFITCKWDGKPLNCCQHMKPITTEYGLCYSINNNQVLEKSIPLYVASSNHRRLGTLELALEENFEAFLHSSDDVPYWNMENDRRAVVKFGSQSTITFSIVDIVNELEVSLTAPDVRQCRFPDESPGNFRGFRHYSYSVCIIQCRIEAQLELCNCTSHLSPVEYKDRYCDLEGLRCLTKHYSTLKKLKVPGVNGTGLNCDCLSSCIEPDYNVVSKRLTEPDRQLKAATLQFILSNRPYERVAREVARTTLDVVVAMGSCFGLFFGGSLLSIVEVLYYLMFKQWKYTNVTKNK